MFLYAYFVWNQEEGVFSFYYGVLLYIVFYCHFCIMIIHLYIRITTMKDTVRKIISTIIAFGWLSTLWFYMYQGLPVIKDYVIQYNYYILGTLWIIFILFFLYFGIVVLTGKWLKVRAIILWLVVILFWYYFINNDPSRWIFAGDIIALLWVLMIYLSLAWLIVTKHAEKKQSLKKQVIIEV